MSDKINSNYLETYSQIFSEKVCADYFGTKQYMGGQEIIQLTPSNQVNLMVIKNLFNLWKNDLEELKRNPYFDYNDYAVQESLKETMNVLSRAIKIQRPHFEPLLQKAVKDTVILAADPVSYFEQELDNAKPGQIAVYLKESSKYIKWHLPIWDILMEKAGLGASLGELKRALSANYDYQKDQLESPLNLLSPLEQIQPIDYEELLSLDTHQGGSAGEQKPAVEDEVEREEQENLMEDLPEQSQHKAAEGAQAIDPALAWAKFESEEYGYMKGSLKNLSESVGINQKFMFTRVLFEGNHDLMMHALKSVDQCDNFVDAIELLNQRFVAELNWDIDSDEVGEFLQLIFRKFDQKV